MEVGQILLVGEDDSLILGDNLAPEALPARGQFPQLFQLTYSANKTYTSGRRAGSPPCSCDQASSVTATLTG